MDDDYYGDYGAQDMQESGETPYSDWVSGEELPTGNYNQPTDWVSGEELPTGNYNQPTASGFPAGLMSLLKSAKLIDDKGFPTVGAAGILGGLYGALQSGQPQQKVGYLGGIPSYSAVRQALPVAQVPGRRPGSGGQRYFTDVQFLQPGQAPAAAPTTNLAAGGIASLAKGGEPRYLAGGTDGMADDLPANIDGKQPARLSHGEFVIPADVVSHLGNGNSESGAERLYAMMEKIRKARTGNPKQGKQINPSKYLPA